MPDALQGVITAAFLLVAGLFVPAVHLQQARDFKAYQEGPPAVRVAIG